MTFSLTWLPEVLRAAGLRVIEQPGWQTRGHGDVKIQFILCHHTASRIGTSIKTNLDLITNGRADLKGPLSQLFLSKDGTFYVIAAGLGYHAGRGVWQGITTGNYSSIGIEADNNGIGEPWPEVQMDAYARGCAAILKHINALPIMCVGHKEYAMPKGRKIDPNFDMEKFRERVASVMSGMTNGRIMVPRFISMLKRWETYRRKAYQDKDDSWHIGYGHGNAAKIPPFVDATTVLKDEAEAMSILMDDLHYLLPIVEKLIKVNVNNNQFCALLDVAYNRGPGTLRESAVIYHLNNPDEIAEELNYKWAARAFVHHENKVDGSPFPTLDTAFDKKINVTRVYLGLELRRIDNAALFQAPIGE